MSSDVVSSGDKPKPPQGGLNEAALAAVMAHPHKLKNMHGSTAGAGSGDFHQYRAYRRIEMDRLEDMETRAKQEQEETEFQRRKAERETEVQEKTSKKAAKRKQQKEKEREKRKKLKEQKTHQSLQQQPEDGKSAAPDDESSAAEQVPQ